ncbi:iron ABC transporter substrate-binding protein [Janthinobacterium sp. BJB446]|uniref:ABC transporter substrate-binding protein n=1 Tax=Janthinobacterium sp. BJB446 TaxID=2048009 RepID=UPI000C0E600F|nr:ABC transporter substrate-binding protein [Janthinobacterium sp. BJB446]PHV23884.1 iron ABC transporter substrate-binding protein [Janthinobacterium sp. BJB446]
MIFPNLAVSRAARLRRVLGAAAVALAACMAWALPAVAQAAGQLNLYCAYPDAAMCQALANGFSARHGVKVSVVQKPTGELYAQIKGEAGNPKGDLWWGGSGDSFLQAAQDGLLETYRSPQLAQLAAWSLIQAEQSAYRSVGVYRAVMVLAYNTELLKKKKLAPPQCWRNLVDPIYKGEIELSNPASSGTAYMMLATMAQLFGEDGAFRYLQQLHPSVTSYSRSGAGPLKAVARGEASIGVAMLHGVMTERENGFPVAYTLPCEGTGAEAGSMAILRNARNLANARLFYDWALGAEAQALPYSLRQYPLPANRGIKLPPGMPDLAKAKFLDYDYAKFGSREQHALLLGRWNKDVASAQ